VRVVWNPSKLDLPLGPPALWSRHRDGPTRELFRSDEPTRDVAVRIPDARPGVYLVATFDGSEGGSHYTWDFVRVRPNKESRAAYDLVFWLVVGSGGALIAIALIALRRSRL
jgi:hypothetical protein